MTSFGEDVEEINRLDYALLQNGAVTLYCRPAYLEEDAAWLVARGYQVHRVDAAAWDSEAEMHDTLAKDLSFPAYYGRNLDALNDCLGDLSVPAEGGFGLVLDRFDAFARKEPRVAQALLDVAEHVSRRHLLFGRRFVVLVQSDDPQIKFAPLGAVSANWNHREWLSASRDPRTAT